jgi:hypothetical protein
MKCWQGFERLRESGYTPVKMSFETVLAPEAVDIDGDWLRPRQGSSRAIDGLTRVLGLRPMRKQKRAAEAALSV